MSLSQRCQYSLRALLELSLRYGRGPVRIAEVAEAQAIPARFLEIVLGQLKQAGLVHSVRGRNGGYELSRLPSEITAGEVIRFCDGPIAPVDCLPDGSSCALKGRCAFMPMWQKARKALSDVYDGTTFQMLMDESKRVSHVSDFSI